MINSTFRWKPEHTSPERPKPGIKTGSTHLLLPYLSTQSELYSDWIQTPAPRGLTGSTRSTEAQRAQPRQLPSPERQGWKPPTQHDPERFNTRHEIGSPHLNLPYLNTRLELHTDRTPAPALRGPMRSTEAQRSQPRQLPCPERQGWKPPT